MRQKKAKALRKLAKALMIDQLRTILSHEEGARLDLKSITEIDRKSESIYYEDGQARLSPTSIKYNYKMLKKAEKQGRSSGTKEA